MQVNKPIGTMATENKNLSCFLQNLNMFTPEQRDIIIKLLEYTIIPRYEVAGKAPIEEEWIRRNKSVLLP